jgi:hypothetical protein
MIKAIYYANIISFSTFYWSYSWFINIFFLDPIFEESIDYFSQSNLGFFSFLSDCYSKCVRCIQSIFPTIQFFTNSYSISLSIARSPYESWPFCPNVPQWQQLKVIEHDWFHLCSSLFKLNTLPLLGSSRKYAILSPVYYWCSYI